jgi:hypothetical protein
MMGPIGLIRPIKHCFPALSPSTTRGAPKELASGFKHAREAKIADLLNALAALGQAREASKERWVS